MSNPGNNPFYAGEIPQNPGNDPFPNTAAPAPPSSDTIGFLGSFGIAAPFLTTGTMAMGALSAQTLTYPQTPVVAMPAGTITKIRTEQNGGAEWTGGTINFRLFKNGVLAWESGALTNAAYTNVPGTIQAQRVLWTDVDIPYLQTDNFAAEIVTASITGGPEGQMMHLWGLTS